MQTDSHLENLLQILETQTEQLLVLLSQKERYVIQRRFNLDNKYRATLEEIGKHFDVTRERIRQIEKNALQKLKRNIEKFQVCAMNNLAFKYLREHGGIMRQDELVSKLFSSGKEFSLSTVLLILSLDKRFNRFGNTIFYHPYFQIAEMGTDTMQKILDHSLAILRNKGDLLELDELVKEVLARLELRYTLEKAMFLSAYTIHKSFKVIDSKIGLVEWRHIHPRTLRDKIYYVLRRKRTAMHFVDIANDIAASNFDKKNLNLQAIHNELIRHNDFVLIGRGIYALKEWGYTHGTVADVITTLLKDNDPMSEEEIIAGVLQHRQVKPITIILNLKNKPRFVRVGRKRYSLQK